MKWTAPFRRSFRITRYRSDVRRDVSDEIEFHLEMRTQELIDTGMEPAAAARLAREAFGERDSIEEACRNMSVKRARKRTFNLLLNALSEDIRYGLRQVLHHPGFSAVAVGTWALCIGANIALFSVINGILLQPLPYPESQRIVSLFGDLPEVDARRVDSSFAEYVQIRDSIDGLESVALFNKVSEGIGDRGNVQNVFCMYTTTGFFDVLDVRPALGRAFDPTDGEDVGEKRVIISHNLWQGRFGGSADVLDEKLDVDGVPHTVIGVMPEGFLFADWEAHLWFPVVVPKDASLAELSEYSGFEMIGRLKSEASVAEVQAQMNAITDEILRSLPPEIHRFRRDVGYHVQVIQRHEDQVKGVRPSLYLLWGAVLFVLLIGCINIGGLLLVRNTVRIRELATRFALGAGRSRVSRQLVTESLVLATVGGGLGLLLGASSLELLGLFEAYEIPRVSEVRLDGWTLGFTVGLTTLVGVLAGLLPALAVPTSDIHSVLRSGEMSGASRVGALRGSLVALQVGAAFVLLVGAALMLTSLHRIHAIDPGFETEGILAGATVVPWDRYSTPSVRHEFVERMLENIRLIPGVEDAAVASTLPFSGVDNRDVLVTDMPTAADSELAAPYRTSVSAGYFATMGLPLREGRAFTARDRGAGANAALVVDERVARRMWPGESAVGKRVRIRDRDNEEARWFTVVGVVGSIVQNDLTGESTNGAFYIPYRDTGLTFMRLAIRTKVDPRSVAGAVKDSLLAMDPESRFFWVQSMEESVAERLVFHRLPMFVLISFAGVALFLSTLGVYGVLAHSVTQRTREIGLRMALGGSRRTIIVLVLKHGLAPIATGLVAGAVGAVGLTRLPTDLLYGIRPSEPLVFSIVSSLIMLAGLVACLIPALRATRVDPVFALKAD